MELSKKELEESRCKDGKQKTGDDAKIENRSIYSQISRSINDKKHRAKNVANNMFMLCNTIENSSSGGVTLPVPPPAPAPDNEKKKTRCPRCHAIIGQIQCLLQYVPVDFTERTDITDICFCAKAQPCSCTQCAELVKKFIAGTEAALYHDKFKFQHYLQLWIKEKNSLLQLVKMNKNQLQHAFDRGSVSVSVNDIRDDLEVRHILQGNKKSSANKKRLNINTTKSQCDCKVLNTSKLDPVVHADMVKLVKSDSKHNVVRLQRESQNNKKSYKPKSLKGNIMSKNPEVNQNKIRHTPNKESPTFQLAKPVQSVHQPFSLKMNYQVTNKKSKKTSQEKTKKVFLVWKNKQEKYIKGRLRLKSGHVDKSEVNDLKINKINEWNLNGINSNAKRFDKTINDKVEENTKVINFKPKNSVINDRHQILKCEDLGNPKVNILKLTKTTIHYDEDDIEENVKDNKGKSLADKPRRINYTETKEPKTINKYESSKNKANENLLLHANDVTVSKYKEKAYSDRAKNPQAKIVKDLITNSLPTKISGEHNKPSPQDIAHLNEHAQKRYFEKELSVNDNIKELNQEYKKQQHNNIQKAGGDAHQLYQTKEKTAAPKQLLTRDLQPVDHLRGGGPKLTERSKTDVIENKIIDRNKNLIQKVNQTKTINILKDPKKQVQENKNYFPQQQQIIDQLQMLKDILSDVSVHQVEEDKRRWLKLRKIKTLPIVSEHESHRYETPGCVICQDSELSLNIQAFKHPPVLEAKPYTYIKENKIFTSKTKSRHILHESAEIKNKPLLFIRNYAYDEQELEDEEEEYEKSDSQTNRDKTIKYALSNREFIDKGWTVLPVEKIIRKLNLYRMRPAHTEFNWFGPNNLNDYITYTTGEKLADCDENGHGRWYYKSGQVALDYYESEEMNQQRIVIYSHDGDVDQSGRSYPLTVLAIFDYSGNGIVFDHDGKIRLKYNQLEGLVLDGAIGPVSRWKWHSLNNCPHLEKVITNTTLEPIDENIVRLANQDIHKVGKIKNNKMIEIELSNAVKEQQKLGNQAMQQFPIKTKILKLNKQFSLRIFDQERIHIILRDGPTHIKFNVGMVLDNSEVISVVSEDIGEIINTVEKEPADTKSLEQLKSYIDAARHTEKMRVEQLRRF